MKRAALLGPALRTARSPLSALPDAAPLSAFPPWLALASAFQCRDRQPPGRPASSSAQLRAHCAHLARLAALSPSTIAATGSPPTINSKSRAASSLLALCCFEMNGRPDPPCSLARSLAASRPEPAAPFPSLSWSFVCGSPWCSPGARTPCDAPIAAPGSRLTGPISWPQAFWLLLCFLHSVSAASQATRRTRTGCSAFLPPTSPSFSLPWL